MSRKGENIYKRKDGRWEGRYIKGRNADGRALYGYIYAHTYKEVRQKLILKKISVPVNPSNTLCTHKVQQNIATFTFLSDEWINYLKPKIKESSYIKYRNILKTYLIPRFNDMLIYEISSDDIESFLQELLTKGGHSKSGLSPKTVTDILSVIRSILRFAKKKGMINICDCMDITITKDIKQPQVLSSYNQQILLKFLQQNTTNKDLGILISLCAGLRIGEVCALRWEDISFTDRTIYVHHTLQRIQTDSTDESKKTKISITSPKSVCSIRYIPISDFLLSILQNPAFSHKGFLLTDDQEKYIEPRTMENYFRKTLDLCNINYVNFHVLRHTFATRCIEVGFDVKSLSEILGHANVSITMNRYVHPSMELKRENMQKLSEIFTVK